jgi:hypothetical protein
VSIVFLLLCRRRLQRSINLGLGTAWVQHDSEPLDLVGVRYVWAKEMQDLQVFVDQSRKSEMEKELFM